MGEGQYSILLIGPPGSGKTTILRGILGTICGTTRRAVVIDLEGAYSEFSSCPNVEVINAKTWAEKETQEGICSLLRLLHGDEVVVLDDAGVVMDRRPDVVASLAAQNRFLAATQARDIPSAWLRAFKVWELRRIS